MLNVTERLPRDAALFGQPLEREVALFTLLFQDASDMSAKGIGDVFTPHSKLILEMPASQVRQNSYRGGRLWAEMRFLTEILTFP